MFKANYRVVWFGIENPESPVNQILGGSGKPKRTTLFDLLRACVSIRKCCVVILGSTWNRACRTCFTFFFSIEGLSVVHDPVMLSCFAGVPEAGSDGGVGEGGHRGRPQAAHCHAKTADMLTFVATYVARVQTNLSPITCLASTNVANSADSIR